MSHPDVELLTMRQMSVRLLPLLFLLYLVCYLDRSNVGMAALQMNKALKFGAGAFGFGAGVFFLGYSLFEVPSNLILARVGARRWIARIAITWGLLSCALMWVTTASQFYVVRFLLGVAEAGFFPGVVYYLGRWYPKVYRARAFAVFMIAIPISQALGGPVGGALLGLNGVGHLAGWQWLFLIEGLPSILLGVVALGYLTERPQEARWLTPEQRDWLARRIDEEQSQTAAAPVSVLRALGNPLVWMLTVPYFAFYTVGLAYVLWAPILVRDALGTSNAATGLVIGLISAFATLTYFIAAWLSDRSDERCAVASLGLALSCTGCIGAALLAHSPLRVGALALMAMCSPLFLASFWCLPTKFLRGTPAAAGIGLISAVGSSGGFFGPNIIGFLKQTSGSDVGAFYGLAALAFVGCVACLSLRHRPAFRPNGVIRPVQAIPGT